MSLVSVTTTATTSTVKLIHGSITVDLLKALNMQSLYDSIITANQPDPGCTISQIQIPFINLNFKDIGIINPISDLKQAISRLYAALLRETLKPIWDILRAILKVLEKFVSFVIDLKLPVLDLHIDDLFAHDLYDKIKAAITKLYYKEKQKVIDILKKLKIPDPFFIDFTSIEKEIEHIVEKIMHSLWDSLLKIIFKIIDVIGTALEAFDIATHGVPTLSVIWKKIVNAVLLKVLEFFAAPFSIEDIEKAIKKFVKAELKKAVDAAKAAVEKAVGAALAEAKKVLEEAEALYARAEHAYYEIMQMIHKFKLPIFGSPFDWHLPLNIKVNIPNLDFSKLVIDIKIWINNFLVNLLLKFMQLIDEILKALGLNFIIPKIKIPFILMESCEIPISIDRLQFA